MKKILLIFAIFIAAPFTSACGHCYNSYINCVDNNFIRWKLHLKSDMEYADTIIGCNNNHISCCVG